MAREKTLRVNIVGDADKLDRELRKSGNSLDKFGKQTRVTSSITSKGFAGMRVAAVGATAAIGGLAIAGKQVVDAAIEAEKTQAKLNAQLKASGISAAQYGAQIESVIQKQSLMSGLDDEDLTESFINLVRVTGDVNKSLDLNVIAMDFARAKNMEVAKAGELVGKVAGGNVGILSRYGITVEKGASATEALGMLQEKFAGQAEAYGKTTGGSIDRASVAFENLQETVGEAAAPAIEKIATKTADFVNEMQTGTGQGGRFVRTLKDIWQEAKPIVTWIGRAIKNVAEFTAEHPNVGRLALAIAGVGTAVKGLKFVSAATGFTDLVKAGRGAARTLKRVLARGGEEAGAAAASNAASGFNAKGGKFSAAGRRAGSLIGRGAVVGVAVGAGIAATEFMDAFVDKIRDKLGEKVAAAVQQAMPGGIVAKKGRDFLKGLIPGFATGGLIPGTGSGDKVPMMGEPGEFVIRKKVVEKFGPTFFAAINEGKAPQMRTSGGIIARANRLDSQRIPYLYGGGHGTKDGYNRSGMDCSASVSYALGISPRVSGALMSFGKPGAGSPNDTKIYANPGHVFAVFNGRGWGTSRENPGGGPGWLSYNHRPGFTIRHLEDGDASSSAASVGDPEETSEPGKMTKRERQERAGSRIVNRIVGRALRGASRQARAASAIGGVIEDAEGGFGRSERFFGQVKGGRPGDFGEEDLGTAQGRADRISELGELKKLKVAQLARMRKRAAALKRVIVKYERALKQMNAARRKAKGAKRAKISERMKSYDDKLTDYKAELRGLGESIADTQLDIGDLEKDIGEVAATPDGSGATDAISAALSDIDLRERAGLLSPEQAQAARIATLQSAQVGGFGGLTQNELLEVMAQLREATSQANEQQAQANQLTADLIASLAAAKASLDANTAFGQQVSAVTGREAIAIFAEILSGHYGAKIQQRGTMPGSGQLSRL